MAKSIAPNMWEKVKAFFDFIEVAESGDDKGVQVIDGQLSVGAQGNGYESVFGEGDSVPVEIAIHYNVSDQTGTTITGATDITAILQSDSGSTVSMFESNVAGEVIMIGSTTPFGGVKTKWSSLGDLEPDRVIGEYFNNVDTWLENTYSVTGANFPYTQHTWNIASELNEQLRFGLSLVNPNLDFEARTLNINGVDQTYYWTRIRLTTPVTTLPVLEQVKSHTNRTEINSDGVVEFFGLARGIKHIEVIETANAASDPTNENVTYFTGGLNSGVSKLVDNEFASNALDSKCYLIKIDDSTDTSTPILLSIPFYVKGIGTGDIEFTGEIVQVTSDFVYDALPNPDASADLIYPIITPQDRERQILQLEIPVNKVDPTTGGVIVVISRDARGSNPNDTLPSNVVLTGSTADGRRWRL